MSGSWFRGLLAGIAVAAGTIATGVIPTGASAQGAPVPNVNDCTFIRDPTALRDCIELYEGQRLAPGPRPAAFQPAPIVDRSLLNAAGPIPGSYTARRGRRQVRREAARRPSRSESVRIQQVAPAHTSPH